MTTTPLLVIVPALNEESTVGEVVSAALAALDCDVVVIDDGSTDETAAEALRAGASVIRHPFNVGVGGAVRTGLRYAHRTERSTVLQLDADGQHEAPEGKRLVDALEHCDLAVGSRFETGYDVGRIRGFMMRRLSRVVSRRLGSPIGDTTSGFRAFNRRSIDVLHETYPSTYLSDTVEALLLASDAGLTVHAVPVRMHQRQGGQPSSGGFRSALYLLRLWLVILMHPIRPTGKPTRK